MDVLPLMLLLGSLFLCGRVEALSSAMDVLKQDARKPQTLIWFN